MEYNVNNILTQIIDRVQKLTTYLKFRFREGRRKEYTETILDIYRLHSWAVIVV